MKRKEFIKKTILGAGAVALFPVAASCWPGPKRDLYLAFMAKKFDFGSQIGILATVSNGDGETLYRTAVRFPAPLTVNKLEEASLKLKCLLPVEYKNRIRAQLYTGELLGLPK